LWNDVTTESCWCCRVNVGRGTMSLLSHAGDGVLSPPSHASDGVGEVTLAVALSMTMLAMALSRRRWPWCDVAAESC
jgi:hypothetical protein